MVAVFISYMHEVYVHAYRESLQDQESLLVIGECGKELDRRTMNQWQGKCAYSVLYIIIITGICIHFILVYNYRKTVMGLYIGKFRPRRKSSTAVTSLET